MTFSGSKQRSELDKGQKCQAETIELDVHLIIIGTFTFVIRFLSFPSSLSTFRRSRDLSNLVQQLQIRFLSSPSIPSHLLLYSIEVSKVLVVERFHHMTCSILILVYP